MPTQTITRQTIIDQIVTQLTSQRDALAMQYRSSGPISTFIVDDLLADDLAHQIYAVL